jgi:hypothetical protein
MNWIFTPTNLRLLPRLFFNRTQPEDQTKNQRTISSRIDKFSVPKKYFKNVFVFFLHGLAKAVKKAGKADNVDTVIKTGDRLKDSNLRRKKRGGSGPVGSPPFIPQ